MTIQRTYRNSGSLILLVSMAIGVAIICGCGSTQQANLWMDPTYSSAPMKKVLVIAMRQDQLRRRMWEDAIVNTLGKKEHAGTVAVASYQYFPDDIPDSQAVRLKSMEEGFDGVLVIAKAQRDTTTSEVPGYTMNEQVTRFSHRWNDYESHYEAVYHPSHTEIETSVSVRTDLYVPQEDGKLVWSVTSQSVDPTSTDQFRSSVADRVASQLKRERLIY